MKAKGLARPKGRYLGAVFRNNIHELSAHVTMQNLSKLGGLQKRETSPPPFAPPRRGRGLQIPPPGNFTTQEDQHGREERKE